MGRTPEALRRASSSIGREEIDRNSKLETGIWKGTLN